MIGEIIARLGIPTLQTTIYTSITTEATIKLGAQLPENVGAIYGLAVDVGGKKKDSNATNNITWTESLNLFLTLKHGSTFFINGIRLDRLVYVQGNSNMDNPLRYFPCLIPAPFALDESQYFNPTAIGTTPSVGLNLFYITPMHVQYMVQQGLLAPWNWKGVNA